MKIAQSDTRDKFPLSTRKVIKKTLSFSIIWGIIFLIGFIMTCLSFAGGDGSVSALIVTLVGLSIVLLLIIFLTYLYQKWYFSVYYYDLGKDYVVIKKGPITPQEITIPYERVQDVYVDQDLLDRLFGLYDVHLSSATISSGMEAHIDGVEKTAADGLKAMLLATVSERISKKKLPTNNI